MMTETKAEPPMRVGIVPVTPLQQNCSLIWCTRTMKGALVDPGGDLDQLKAAAYFHRQVAWLQDHFPEAEIRHVPGLVKVVDRKEI